MKCEKCGSAVEYFIGSQDGVFIDSEGKVFVDRTGELMEQVFISCSKEGCDWSTCKDLSPETTEQIALEAGLITEPPVISLELQNTLESLNEQN